MLDELDGDDTDPYDRLDGQILSALWGSAVSRRAPGGHRRVIERATPAELREIHRRFYVPNQALLVVAGDIDFSQATGLARSLFNGWVRGEKLATPTFDAPAQDQVVVEESATGDAMFVLELRGPDLSLDPRGVFAGAMLGGIASIRDNSFLHRIGARGANWMNSSFTVEPYRTLGTIRIECHVKAENAKQALEAWLSETSALARPDYFREDELRLTKQEYLATRTFARETTDERAREVAMWWRLADFDRYKSYERDVQSVTLPDIANFARKYLHRKPLVLGVVAPKAALAEHGLTRQALIPWLARIRGQTEKTQ